MLRISLLAAFCFMSACAHAECVAPSHVDQENVRTYVSEQYPAFAIEHLFLTHDSQATSACFWEMTFTSATNGRRMTVFLSPDRKYITPVLFDLSISPRRERALQAQATAHELTKQTGAFRGSPNAPVTLVEFSDFQCPYCKSLSMLLNQEVLPQEQTELRILYRQFPLSMHSWAASAAYVSKCVEMQNPSAFWPVHDFLFQNQSTLSPANIRERLLAWAAAEHTLDIPALTSCIDGKLSVSAVEKKQHLGESAGVEGTPTLFLNGVLYDGPRDAQSIRAAIRAAAQTSSRKPTSSGQAQSFGSEKPVPVAASIR